MKSTQLGVALLFGVACVAMAGGCRGLKCVPARPLSVVEYPALTGRESPRVSQAWASADAVVSIQEVSAVTDGLWVVLTLSTKGGETRAREMMQKLQDEGFGWGSDDVLGSEIVTAIDAGGQEVDLVGAFKGCRDYYANPNGIFIPVPTGPHFTDEQLREPVVVRRGEKGWTYVQTRIGFAYRSGKRETPVQALLTPDFDWAGFFGMTSVHVDTDALPVVPWPE